MTLVDRCEITGNYIKAEKLNLCSGNDFRLLYQYYMSCIKTLALNTLPLEVVIVLRAHKFSMV